ncbi:hypothetical protein ACVDG3_14295 [Meridianimarinicoccus sp. RP-17]|uniref:hypothetical protein n=1 Tax=Meridianimarinicoccus zhengii TaxID=2056810 RepID=UPI000DAD5B7E|nr:hypothetical protein [Phycocomes zhengii]
MLMRHTAATALLVAAVLGAALVAAEETDPVAAAFDGIETAIDAGDLGRARALVDGLLARPDLSDVDTAAALGQLATIETEAGRPEAAIAALGSALQFDPNNFWLRMRSCNVNRDFGFLAAARQDCALAGQALRHERDPGMAQLMHQYLDFTRANIALAFGDVEGGLALVRGLEAAQETLYFAPWYLDALAGRLLSRGGDAQAALVRFRQALADYDAVVEAPDGQGDIDRADLHFSIGQQLERLGRTDEARVEYDLAFAVLPDPGADPEEPAAALPAQVETIAYAACSLNLRLERAAAAVDQCGWLSDRRPGRIAYLDALGLAYELSGDAARARAVHERARELDPDNPLLRDSLGQRP